jgi:hypothetical protein
MNANMTHVIAEVLGDETIIRLLKNAIQEYEDNKDESLQRLAPFCALVLSKSMINEVGLDRVLAETANIDAAHKIFSEDRKN